MTLCGLERLVFSFFRMQHVETVLLRYIGVVKVKFAQEQAMKGQSGSRDSLSLTSAINGWFVVNATPWLFYTQERNPVPFAYEVLWAPGPMWTGAADLATTGIRSSDRPTTLSRRRYIGMHLRITRLGKAKVCVNLKCCLFLKYQVLLL
jgi:hypothetical protein